MALSGHQQFSIVQQLDIIFLTDSHIPPVLYLCEVYIYTSAVLRLECSIDCISGSVGHQQNIFRSFSHCQFLLKNKFQTNVSGSVGHHQCYINWFSAPYPSYIQTFKIIR